MKPQAGTGTLLAIGKERNFSLELSNYQPRLFILSQSVALEPLKEDEESKEQQPAMSQAGSEVQNRLLSNVWNHVCLFYDSAEERVSLVL